jgi:hypothetical protein
MTREQPTPVDINALEQESASSRAMFDEIVGIEASELTDSEIEQCRTEVYRHLARTSRYAPRLKTHDAYTKRADGEPLFPKDASLGAIYLIRNPLDVAASYASHLGRDVDEVISTMADDGMLLGSSPGGFKEQLPQRILSWSSHVLSWVEQKCIPVRVIRYEDMIERPLDAFRSAAEFARLPTNKERLEIAVHRSHFLILRDQERQTGFAERYRLGQIFFRKGVTGSWRETLTDAQARRILLNHADVMARFGYLARDGSPVY